MATTSNAEAIALRPGDTPTEPSLCRACGSAIIKDYCADCGFKIRTGRRSLYRVGQDLLNSLLRADSKTLQSFFALLTAPGSVSLDSAQDTGRFVGPAKLFFSSLFLFTVFIAFSPYKFAQLHISTIEEVAAVYGQEIPPGFDRLDTQLNMLFFAPDQTTVVTDGVRDALANEDHDYLLSIDPRWIEPMQSTQTPFTEAIVANRTVLIMSYTPLAIVFPIMFVNGLIYRRSRFLSDHILTAFETASFLLFVMIFVTSFSAIADQLGWRLWVTPPLAGLFEFALMPLFVLGIALVDRRFYQTAWYWLLPKAVLIAILWVPFAAFLSLWAIQAMMASVA